MNQEIVHFKVDGEWLTKFFRERFWDDKCGFDNVIKIIHESLGAEFTEDMCIAILEGRKKLVGVNEFNYIDDNEEIRPLTKYLREQEYLNKINKIISNIESTPREYIDAYSCTTNSILVDTINPQSISELYQVLVHERGIENDVLENGCIWFDNLETTAKMIMRHIDKTYVNRPEFAKIIFDEYEETIERYRTDKIPFGKLSDYAQAIVCRNRHYAFINKMEWSYLDETGFFRRAYKNEVEKEECENTVIKDKLSVPDNGLKSKEEIDMILEKEKIKRTKDFANNPHMNNFFRSYGLGDVMDVLKSEPFNTNPVEPISGWDGYIDPDGNFYTTKPIGVGWYNGTANCHYEWAAQYIEENNIELGTKDAKDYIIDILGWCDMSHFVLTCKDVYVNHSRKNGVTKKQIDTLTKLFELNNDDIKKLHSLLEN